MRWCVASLLVVAGCTAPPHARDTGERGSFVVRSATPPPPSSTPAERTSVGAPKDAAPDPETRRKQVMDALEGRAPRAWGQTLDGVLTTFETDSPRVALTLDACGGRGGDEYDEELIDLLRAEQIPATLFLTARWIAENRGAAEALAAEPLFELENHGDHHRPCSVNGRSAYSIRGTRSLAEAIDEITEGARAIESLTGAWPRYYRPGTAYFDDVCLDAVQGLGARPMGYSVVGDAGGGFGRAEIARQIGSAPSGAVILVHMNKPRGSTREGLRDALPRIRARAVEFVRLDQVPLR
ncbi:MAG: polysaccharide deacetylase family protein [Polyangiaceae bacterium]